MTKDDDTAALIAEAQAWVKRSRFEWANHMPPGVMPPKHASLIARLAAALSRAQADASAIEIERETNGATALLLQQTRATLAAREALHGKDIGAQRTTRSVAIAVCVALGLDLPRHIDAAEQAINAELDIVGLDYDTAIVVQPRALAAEIAAALGGKTDV